MHACPDCGTACDCDGEDTWLEATAGHECISFCDDDGFDEEFEDED